MDSTITIIFGITATILSIVAIGISIWQGFLSKQQLEKAKETKDETQKLLSEINIKITEIKGITDETRKDVKEQISNMINKNDENFKELLKSGKEIDQNQLMNTLLPALLKNPNGINSLMELAKLGNNK